MQKTLTAYLLDARNRPSNLVAIKFKKDRKWQQYKWQQYYELVEDIGCALLDTGITKGDRVAIMANTRPEWSLADMAILGVGAVTVPIYQNNRAEEMEYILSDSEAKILIVESAEQLAKWQQIRSKCENVKLVICLDNSAELPSSSIHWNDFLTSAPNSQHKQDGKFAELCEANNIDQLATIIYTSGTTGQPKGVVLTHKQIISEVINTFPVLGVDERDVSLSFLPYAHVLGRVESFGNVYSGYTLAFAESIERIGKNFVEIKPTLFIGVPRIFEKLYNALLTQVEAHPLKKRIFDWAVQVGREVSACRVQKKAIPLATLAQYKAAKRLVFDKFRERLGGRVRFAISGGAPLSKEISEFFHAADLLVLEGYGLTETTAAISFNTPFDYEFGTVGKPTGTTEVKIAEDGEILIKSDTVMREYYNNPEATAEVMKDGYFATGDIGTFTEKGNLKITDRKKDLIKTAGGKYVAPQKLENLLKLNKYISNVLIHGDQRKYIVALVTLDEDAALKFASDNNLSFQGTETLADLSQLKDLVREGVAEANSQLDSFETIKNFDILPRDFTIESGELTPSLKVKRKICDNRYKDRIDKLYGADRSVL